MATMPAKAAMRESFMLIVEVEVEVDWKYQVLEDGNARTVNGLRRLLIDC